MKQHGSFGADTVDAVDVGDALEIERCPPADTSAWRQERHDIENPGQRMALVLARDSCKSVVRMPPVRLAEFVPGQAGAEQVLDSSRVVAWMPHAPYLGARAGPLASFHSSASTERTDFAEHAWRVSQIGSSQRCGRRARRARRLGRGRGGLARCRPCPHPPSAERPDWPASWTATGRPAPAPSAPEWPAGID